MTIDANGNVIQADIELKHKRVRLSLKWRGKIIKFVTLLLANDGSIIVAPAFFSDTTKYPSITTGTWHDNSDLDTAQSTVPNVSGLHMSLHPGGQKVHIKQNHNSSVVAAKSLSWFPVASEFLLAKVTSPPMDECDPDANKTDFVVDVPDEYSDSVDLYIRVFPWADIFQFEPKADVDLLKWVMGVRKDQYWIVGGFFKANARLAPALQFPKA